MWPDSFHSYQTCTSENVCTAFGVTGLVQHSVETFIRHAPVEQEDADAKLLELLAQILSGK